MQENLEEGKYDVVTRMRRDKDGFRLFQRIGSLKVFEDGPAIIKIDMDKVRFLGEDYGELEARIWKQNR